ncbi:BTAD domain-containing putative transcriptional regulator [Actinomadura yumaensis]|uniref:BTAD domain-containing putative transcriptional regulator n=1 Tax=Actinomadura yumaensis TaxID=111807 RepID=A0ABW2CNM2_9ACTN
MLQTAPAPRDHVHIVVLDGITVYVDGTPRRIQPHQAAALLVLAASDTPLTGHDLAEYLWPDDDPRRHSDRPIKILSALRRILGAARLPRTGRGYKLTLYGDDILDLDLWRRNVHHASRAAEPDPGAAAIEYDRALSLFTGLPDDLPDTDRMTSLCESLIGERLDVVEALARVRLDIGLHSKVAEQLPDLVRRWPEREQLLDLLMRAQYRAQRRGAALRQYEQYLQRLGDAKPSKDLAHLHQQILDDDPALASPPFEPPVADRNVIDAGADPARPQTFRISGYFAYLAAWTGYPTAEDPEYHSAADRAAAGLLTVAAPSMLTIQYEAGNLADILVQAAIRAGISTIVEVGALVPTNDSVHATARKLSADARTLYLSTDGPLVTYSRQKLGDTPAAAFIKGSLETFLTGHAHLPDWLDLTEPILLIDQYANGLERDKKAYADLYAVLGDRLAPRSRLYVNAPTADGISPAVVWALADMYRSAEDEQLYPSSRDEVAALLPPGWRYLRQQDVEFTTDVWEIWAGRRSPEQARPGPLPRNAIVAEKPHPGQ